MFSHHLHLNRLPFPLLRPRNIRWNSSVLLSGTYADKLRAKLAQESVSSVDELKAKLKAEGRVFVEPSAVVMPPKPTTGPTQPEVKSAAKPRAGLKSDSKTPSSRSRIDGAPVKPLSELLNLSTIARKPHTAEQITALWTLYHASRSSGTGRGYISAVVPLQSYEIMLARAKRWPMFVIPIPRPPTPSTQVDQPDILNDVNETPLEFHLLQWGIHPSLVPEVDPFERPPPSPAQPPPHVSTILFTSLIEYQRHQTYAPPYFVITHYTDFARSHGIVLLRGEITPRSASMVTAVGAQDKYMLSQTDAQLLALGLQRFYLPPAQKEGDAPTGEVEASLLKTFNETPGDFRWEDLLKAWRRW